MHKNKILRAARTLALGSGLLGTTLFTHAAVSLETFESGTFAGWTVSGTGWTVGGAAGIGFLVTPAEGAFFARSGAPNIASGSLAESNTGTVTSSAFLVSHDTLTWRSAGWSGPAYSGLNFFQILDTSQQVRATVQTAQSDSWTTASVDLIAAGFAPGDTLHFRAVDNNAANSYAWVAFDDVQLTGNLLPVPEVEQWSLLLAGLGLMGLMARRRR